jgi:hypothetical protein
MNDRSSISRIWLGFEDSGATTPSAPNTYRGSLSWCPRTYLVPACRPNQKRSCVSSTGSVIPADRRGADRGNRITMDSSKRKGPGCKTNQIDGLVDFVLRCFNGSLIAAGQWTPEESIVGGSFQLCSGSHASRPVSYPTVSKNRFASKELLLFSMVYTVRPSFWARIDRALALPYLLTNRW